MINNFEGDLGFSMESEKPVSLEREASPQVDFVSNYQEVAQQKAEQLTSPEMAKVISAVITEIDRQGIESFTTYETEKGKWPVSVVSITDIFEKFFADQTPRPEVESSLDQEPKRRSTLIIPGFSPPPIGHPFTPWDYVYNQVFTDLPRLFAAWKRGETLPQIDVRVLGSANSDWGEVTPEYLQQIQSEGFRAHGEMVAGYLKEELADADYIRVNGISMGSLIATEAMDKLSDEELAKMQFVLDNPADQYYKNRLLKMLRAVQLPLGMGLDFAQVLARLPHYGEVYKGEPGFLEKINGFLAKRKSAQGESDSIPHHVLLKLGLADETKSDEEQLELTTQLGQDEQMALKKHAFKAECLLLLKQPTADLDKRVFIRKGITDLTTSTFGDVMFSLLNKLGRGRLFRQLGRRKLFTVNKGHQRDNYNVEKWARVIERGKAPLAEKKENNTEVQTDEQEQEVSQSGEVGSFSRIKNLIRNFFKGEKS
jgi:hypothetical protein